jgi:predicted RNase H-like nuclease (RuvC/YqgF family)
MSGFELEEALKSWKKSYDSLGILLKELKRCERRYSRSSDGEKAAQIRKDIDLLRQEIRRLRLHVKLEEGHIIELQGKIEVLEGVISRKDYEFYGKTTYSDRISDTERQLEALDKSRPVQAPG